LNFQEAEKKYAQLRQQVDARQITSEEFWERVNQLQVLSDDGTWWQIRGQDGVWLRWDGAAWVEAAGAAPAAPAQRTGPKAQPGNQERSQSTEQPVTAGRQTQNTSSKAGPQPETLGQLLLLILRRIPQAMLQRLPMILGLGIGVWALHTFLLVGPNGGFAPGTNWFLDRILALKGRAIAGTLFWGMAAAFLPAVLRGLRSGGLSSLVSRVTGAPACMISSFQQAGKDGLPILLGGCAGALVLGTFLSNDLVSFMIGSSVFVKLTSWRSSPLYTVVRLSWSDIQRYFNRNNPARFDFTRASVILSGVALGFFVAALLPFQPWSGYAGALVMMAAAFVMRSRAHGGGMASLLLFVLTGLGTVLINARQALADDGGWAEAGGNLGGWMASQGAIIAISMGLLPGLGAAIGAALGGVAGVIPIDTSGLDGDTGDQPPSEDPPPEFQYWVSMSASAGSIKADGSDAVWVYAQANSNDPEANTYEMTSSMNFSAGGEYGSLLSVGEMQVTGGYAVVAVTAFAQPDRQYSSPQGSAAVHASTLGPQGSIGSSEHLTLLLPASGKLEKQVHGDKKSILADGADGAWLYARVAVDSPGPDFDQMAVNNTISFSPSGAGSDWLEISEPGDTDGWKAVFVQASNPTGGIVTAENQPATVTVAMHAQFGEMELSNSATFNLLPPAALDVDKDKLTFLAGLDGSAVIKAFVQNPGAEEWDIQGTVDPNHEGIVSVEVEALNASQANATIICGAPKSGEKGFTTVVVNLTAEKGETRLEREVKVFVAQAGLLIRDAYYGEGHKLLADGKETTEVDFVVLKWDEGQQDLVTDQDLVQRLTYEDVSEDEKTQNAIKAAELQATFDRIRPSNSPSGVYKFKTARSIPADGQALPVRLQFTVPDLEGEEYTAILNLGLKTIDMGPGSQAWEEEYQKTLKFINDVAPGSVKDRFLDMLEARKYTFGAEGLYKFRHQVWNACQDIMLAEAKSYEAEAAWQDYYLEILNWTKWLGDQCFGIVSGVLLGPGYTVAAVISKDTIYDILDAYVNGMSAWDFINNRIKSVINEVGNWGTDPVELSKKIGPVKACALFFSFRFLYNLYTNDENGKPRSAADAAWQTVKDCTAQAVGVWLGKVCEREAVLKGWTKGEAGAGGDGGESGGGSEGGTGDGGGASGGKSDAGSAGSQPTGGKGDSGSSAGQAGGSQGDGGTGAGGAASGGHADGSAGGRSDGGTTTGTHGGGGEGGGSTGSQGAKGGGDGGGATAKSGGDGSSTNSTGSSHSSDGGSAPGATGATGSAGGLGGGGATTGTHHTGGGEGSGSATKAGLNSGGDGGSTTTTNSGQGSQGGGTASSPGAGGGDSGGSTGVKPS